MMIESLIAAFDKKLRLEVVAPASIIVEGDVSKLVGRGRNS